MDLQRLRYFVAVAEECHFTRAAARLHLDQGALSSSIRRLERDLGMALFTRTSRRVELTTAGAALLPQARAMVDQADAFMTSVRAQRETTRTEIVVGLHDEGAAELNLPIVEAFRATYPGLTLRMVALGYAELTTGMRDGTLDAIVGWPEFADRDRHEVTPLVVHPTHAFLASHHPLADSTHVLVADLLDQPFLHSDGTAVPQRVAAHAQLAAPRNGEPVKVVGDAVSSGPEMMLTIALTGGICVGSKMLHSTFPGVVYREVLDAAPTCTSVVTRRETRPTPRGRAASAFAAVARDTARALIDLVPDGSFAPAHGSDPHA